MLENVGIWEKEYELFSHLLDRLFSLHYNKREKLILLYFSFDR